AMRATTAHRRIRDENVLTDVAHHLRLECRRASESDRAARQLLARDARRLVRLDVRPEPERMAGCVLGRAVEITGEPIQVDDRDWRLEVVDGELGIRGGTTGLRGGCG